MKLDCNSNTTLVKVKLSLLSGLGIPFIIQIQLLLKLNTQALRELQQRKPNSNTTLVKVK